MSDTFLRFLPAPTDPSWSPGWVPMLAGEQSKRFEDLTQSAFLWYNFLVRADFRLGGADFSESGPPFCLLDFVLMMQTARRTLQHDRLAAVELSDRAGEWVFELRDGLVRLRKRDRKRGGYVYHGGAGSCPFETFDELVDQSLVDALALIFAAQPGLRRNPYLQRLAADAATTGLPPKPSS